MRTLKLTALLFSALLMIAFFQNCGSPSQFRASTEESSFNSKVHMGTFVHERSTGSFDGMPQELQGKSFEFLFLSDQDSQDITEFGILKAKDTVATHAYWSIKGDNGESRLSKNNPLKDMEEQSGTQNAYYLPYWYRKTQGGTQNAYYLPYWYRRTQGLNGLPVWKLSYFSETEQDYLDFESSEIQNIKKDSLEVLILNEFIESTHFENAEKAKIDWNLLSAICLDTDCKTIIFNLSKVE